MLTDGESSTSQIADLQANFSETETKLKADNEKIKQALGKKKQEMKSQGEVIESLRKELKKTKETADNHEIMNEELHEQLKKVTDFFYLVLYSSFIFHLFVYLFI